MPVTPCRPIGSSPRLSKRRRRSTCTSAAVSTPASKRAARPSAIVVSMLFDLGGEDLGGKRLRGSDGGGSESGTNAGGGCGHGGGAPPEYAAPEEQRARIEPAPTRNVRFRIGAARQYDGRCWSTGRASRDVVCWGCSLSRDRQGHERKTSTRRIWGRPYFPLSPKKMCRKKPQPQALTCRARRTPRSAACSSHWRGGWIDQRTQQWQRYPRRPPRQNRAT